MVYREGVHRTGYTAPGPGLLDGIIYLEEAGPGNPQVSPRGGFKRNRARRMTRMTRMTRIDPQVQKPP